MFIIPSNITFYSFDGNIGSGKSTVVSKLKSVVCNRESDGSNKNIYYFLQEPVDEWNTICDTSGINILTKFYANQEKYSFAFQMMAYISRLAQLKETISEIINNKNFSLNNRYFVFSERSVFTDKNVFAKMLYDSGKIEDIEYQIYNKWFDNFIKELPQIKYIYIQTSPDIAYERILKRNREGESIEKEYICSCHNYHEDWLIGNSEKNSEKNLKIIDGNNNADSVLLEVMKYLGIVV